MEEQLEITAVELKRLIDSEVRFNLVDVGEPHEYDLCQINGSQLVPLGQIPRRSKNSTQTMSTFSTATQGTEGVGV
jgi:rhodanese-related sulfurtransferase